MRRVTTRLATAAAAGVMASVLLGAAVASAAPISKDEFITKGDAICVAGDAATSAKIAKAFPDLAKSNKAPSKADQKKIVKILVAGINDEIKKLKKLGIPSGDEQQVNAIYAAVKKEIAAVKKHPSSLFSGDPLNQSSALASSYGFQRCGQGSD